ncbi:MAG: beta-lactamase family protein, partial [marine benthic group bacterium]|nr:beta-lactamase family protein [Gemmatimonadota bacterium]
MNRLDMHSTWAGCFRMVAATAAALTIAGPVAPAFGQTWESATFEAVGLDPAPLVALDSAIRAGRFDNVDRLVVVRDGKLVFSERYPRNYDSISSGFDMRPHQFNYQHPDWHPFYMGQDLHSLQSVTKSVTSALIGIAIGRGELPGVDAPLLPLLSEYDTSGTDERLERATLEDLLTMRLGIEWHEQDRPIGPENTTIQLEFSDDWVEFTLSQPMDAVPGERFVYNSGASHLMSAIVRSATGRTVDLYAEEHLFGPLGIDSYHWKREPAGLPDTEGGLYLEAEDLARIGQLYLNDGLWRGVRLLPEGWVEASVSRHVDDVAPENPNWNAGYGYQWWRVDSDGVEVWAGLGYGGQYLLVLPDQRIV